ncbi:MAG: RNA polymerase sigma-70 factor (ECF subfamily) [Glaciecola sp.]|jgi:RNA polymerase sigma-70 factor (ECF subfamily)
MLPESRHSPASSYRSPGGVTTAATGAGGLELSHYAGAPRQVLRTVRGRCGTPIFNGLLLEAGIAVQVNPNWGKIVRKPPGPQHPAIPWQTPTMESTSTHPELERLLTHQDWLRSLARRLVGDAATAEDLVQETWIAALKSPPDPTRPAKPWLAGVVRRLASMRARGEGRRARRQTEVARPDIVPSTSDLVEEVDTQRRLVAEVLELSEPYRTTVMLRYFQNMSSAEIARHQGVPGGTVRWRLKRGLDELRVRLDDSFGSRDTWCIALLPLAKLGLGTGAAAGSVSGGTVVGSMALLAKVAAGILALWGLFEIPSLLADKANLVWANDSSAELVSLKPEGPAAAQAAQVDTPTEVVKRDSVAPANRRVRFLDGNREPIEGLRVALDDDRDVAPIGFTDERGEVEFVTALQKGELYIQQVDSFLRRLPVEFTAAGIDVLLVSGAQLTGRILAGEGEQTDSIAMAQLELRLDSDQVLWEDGQLPRGIAAHFEQATRIQITTDEFGAFQFMNLPQDWSGKLWLPSGVVVHGADRRERAGRYVYFGGPRSDEIVSVQRLPRLRGIALGLEGAPAAGAKILCWMDGAEAPMVGLSSEDGTFDVQLDSDGSSGMRVELVSSDDQSSRALQFAGDQIPSGFNLGEVQLGLTSRLVFQAVTPEGVGIAGATVVQDGIVLPGSPSDANGQGEVQLPSDVDSCTVHAFGFQPAEVLAGQGGEELRLEMAPAAMVTWHVINDRGHSLDGVTLRVRSADRLFAIGEAFAPSVVDRSKMVGKFVQVGEDEGKGQRYAEFTTDQTGRVQLSNLTLGAPIWVDVLDQVGHLIHGVRLGAPIAGERKLETIEVPGRLHGFYGLVQERGGNVLVGVELELADVEGQSVRTLSGLDGKALLEGLAGNRYDLTVSKRGFVAQTITNLSFSAGMGSSEEKPYEVMLERAADVSVLVLSGANVPVPGGHIDAHRVLDGHLISAGPVGSAQQTLQDLDQGTIELTLTLGGVQYTVIARPHLDRSVEFRVPAHGAALVTWNLPEDLETSSELALVAVALDLEGTVLADREPVRMRIGERTSTQGVTEFPALLPGSYSIELLGPAPVAEKALDELSTPAPKAWVQLAEPVKIQVGLTEPARVDVRL